jgi:prolyl 4-hydroxylase
MTSPTRSDPADRVEILAPGGGRPYVEGDSLDLTRPLVFTVADLLDADECAAHVARIDALAPTDAPITTSRGPLMRPDIRNNRRAIFDDTRLAADLFARLLPVLPDPLALRRPVGLNERFRCYLYDPGQRFAPHYDGAYRRDDGDASLLTFMVYLNDGFTGGATAFHHLGLDVVPRRGLALLFQHHLLHEGCAVETGHKYVLRTDVMYSRG